MVKNILPFYKLIIGKTQVFSARSYVYLHGYTQIRPNRVLMYLSLSLLTYFTSYAPGLSYLSLNVSVSSINDNRVLIFRRFASRALGLILNVSRIDIAIIFHFICTILSLALNFLSLCHI